MNIQTSDVCAGHAGTGERRWTRFIAEHGIPLLVGGAVCLLFIAFGFKRFHIMWNDWHMLDRVALSQAPWQSLALLHAQPPLLNAVFAMCLAAARATTVSPEFWMGAIWLLLAWLSIYFLYRALRALDCSPRLAALGLLPMIGSPAFYLFMNWSFYPFILNGLFSLLLFLGARLASTGGRRHLFGYTVTLCLLSCASSLYHPVWALVQFGLTAGFAAPLWRRRWPGVRIPLLTTSALLVLLLFAWPMKNYLLFGDFTYSSWEGYNLTRGAPISSDTLTAFIAEGRVADPVRDAMNNFLTQHRFSRPEALSRPTKSTGGRNWNHYILLLSNRPLKRAAWQWRWEHPAWWLIHAWRGYLAWTQPAYVWSYTGRIMGPETELYRVCAHLHEMLFFADLRRIGQPPALAYRPMDSALAPDTVAYTAFGFVLFPALMLSALGLVLRRLTQRRFGEVALLLPACWTILWVLVVPCFSDAYEGNRMRFSLAPCFATLLVTLAKAALVRFQAARSRAA
ncbi:MAG: hypothetical protein QME60_02675 [Verrucomicrobiota bacterium]|nr:hypothetical protein [Verrucomicrobiota bacterium]